MNPSIRKAPMTSRSADPRHWLGPHWLGLYRNADDPRLFVPKRWSPLGKTLNLAHPGAKWPLAMSAAAIIIGIAISVGEWLAT